MIAAVGRKLLVVDDDPGLRATLSQFFKGYGYQVLEAGTLAEAEDRLSQRPDLIILDCILGAFSGEKFLDRLKAQGATRAIPVIAVSGAVSEGTLKGLEKRGAAAAFRKPLKTAELLARVQALLAPAVEHRPPSEWQEPEA
jgi:DNA-binding response OmpR family regulator